MNSDRIQAQRILLSACVRFPDDAPGIAQGLTPQHFAGPDAEVFAKVQAGIAGGLMPYYDQLQASASLRAAQVAKAEIMEAHTRDRVKGFASELLRIVDRVADPIGEAVAGVQGLLSDSAPALMTMQQAAQSAANSVQEAYEAIQRNEPPPNSVPSGIQTLNAMTGYLRGGDLAVIAARPAMGKSTITRCIAQHAAKHGHPVLIFPTEMSEASVALSLMAGAVPVAQTAARSGAISLHELNAIRAWAEKIGGLPISMSSSARHIDRIRAIAETWLVAQAGKQTPVIMVDHISQLAGSGANREREVAQIMGGLLGLAVGGKALVIAVSQLSRAVETRGGDKRPLPSDLRDSGSIEQDATHILLAHRPAAYGMTTDEEGRPVEPGDVCLNLAKNRFGQTGDIWLNLDFMRHHITELPR
jgi:replicative DNA helicase